MILKGSVIRAINLGYFSLSLPLFMFILTTVYTSTGGTLTPKSVFLTLSLLSTIRFTSVFFMLRATIEIAEGAVALKRIQVSHKSLDITTLSFFLGLSGIGEFRD